MDVLSHKFLIRPGANSGTTTTQERHSVDFIVNGASLLTTIVKVAGGHTGFMGCIVRGFSEHNVQAAGRLTCAEPPDSGSGRVLLYICPECGDIGCGAYSAFVRRVGTTYIWHEFAYENGYESPRPFPDIGPYIFDSSQYEAEITLAGAR